MTQFIQTTSQQSEWLFYLLIFGIMLIETGAALLPFLPPAEYVIFIIATMAGMSQLHLSTGMICFMLILACIAGDGFNFWLGYHAERFLLRYQWFHTFTQNAQFKKWESFFNQHGSLAMMSARFIPLIRSLAIFFIAGIGVPYKRFLPFNAIASVIWVILWYTLGQKFGHSTFFTEHYKTIMVLFVIIFLLLTLVPWLKNKMTALYNRNNA